jgi:hypothetical protein
MQGISRKSVDPSRRGVLVEPLAYFSWVRSLRALSVARKVWKTKAEHIFTLSNWMAQRPGSSRKELPAPDRIATR